MAPFRPKVLPAQVFMKARPLRTDPVFLGRSDREVPEGGPYPRGGGGRVARHASSTCIVRRRRREKDGEMGHWVGAGGRARAPVRWAAHTPCGRRRRDAMIPFDGGTGLPDPTAGMCGGPTSRSSGWTAKSPRCAGFSPAWARAAYVPARGEGRPWWRGRSSWKPGVTTGPEALRANPRSIPSGAAGCWRRPPGGRFLNCGARSHVPPLLCPGSPHFSPLPPPGDTPGAGGSGAGLAEGPARPSCAGWPGIMDPGKPRAARQEAYYPRTPGGTHHEDSDGQIPATDSGGSDPPASSWGSP